MYKSEQYKSNEPGLHWNAQLGIYLALLGLILASCVPVQATETPSPTSSPTDIHPAITFTFTPEAEPVQEIATQPTEAIETIDQIIESFSVGNVDLTKPTMARIPSDIWELLVKNKTGVDKSGDHDLLVTEPHLLTGLDWADESNREFVDTFNMNEFTAWLPSNPTEQWHVSLLLDTNVPGHNASINHSYWKKSFGEIGYYAGSADIETQVALIGQSFTLHNMDNPNNSVNAKFLAITTIPATQYESWTYGPSDNIQADLYGMGIPQDILEIQDSNIIHIITCMPIPGTEYSSTNPSANSAYRAIISLELTDPTP